VFNTQLVFDNNKASDLLVAESPLNKDMSLLIEK
jgi:hypothetical protein